MADHPDFLRSSKNLFNADPRSEGYSVLDETGWRPRTIDDHYYAVSRISLHEAVPPKIVVKFETAKNLNLFSWFVYRFHSAARSHAYECLEFALRTRFAEELFTHEEQKHRAKYEEARSINPQNGKAYKPLNRENFRPTLQLLLKYAIEAGALKNERFTTWQTRTKIRARSRQEFEELEKFKASGVSEMRRDTRDPEVTDEDRDHDYLSTLLENIPPLRNLYAHGTSSLDDKSLSALRLASEIINQIFPGPDNL